MKRPNRWSQDEDGMAFCDDREYEEQYCIGCSGSGEGHYDGTRCSSCGGSGTEYVLVEPEPEPEDEEQDA